MRIIVPHLSLRMNGASSTYTGVHLYEGPEYICTGRRGQIVPRREKTIRRFELSR
jgi:hypothetical protein